MGWIFTANFRVEFVDVADYATFYCFSLVVLRAKYLQTVVFIIKQQWSI